MDHSKIDARSKVLNLDLVDRDGVSSEMKTPQSTKARVSLVPVHNCSLAILDLPTL